MSLRTITGAAWGLVVVTPPAEEPVTVAEARAHCRIDTADEDALLADWIVAAREYVELHTRRALVTQTLRCTIGGMERFQRLPRPPLASIVSVVAHDDAGGSRTIDPECYLIDTDDEPGLIQFPSGVFRAGEIACRGSRGSVRVTYTAGYGAAAAVPRSLKAAIKLIVGDLYEHREARLETAANDNPTVQRLLQPFCVREFA